MPNNRLARSIPKALLIELLDRVYILLINKNAPESKQYHTYNLHEQNINTPQASLSATLPPNSTVVGCVIEGGVPYLHTSVYQNGPSQSHAVRALYNICQKFE